MKPDNIKRRTAPRRPKGYYGNWERRQTVKAKELKTKIRYVRKRIDRYVKRHPEYMRLKTVLPLGITIKRYGFSFGGWWENWNTEAAHAGRPASSTSPQSHGFTKWPGRLPTDLLDDLIRFTAGEAVYGTFSADSTHHRFNRYILIDYTKKGKARGRKAGKNDAPEGKRWASQHMQAPCPDLPERHGAGLHSDRQGTPPTPPCLQDSVPSCQKGEHISGRQCILLLGQRSGRSHGQGSVL